jgi:HNH endonuclease/NUMOD4 motif
VVNKQRCKGCNNLSAAPFCVPCLAKVVVSSYTQEAECWVPIDGYPGFLVSSFGRVINHRSDELARRRLGRLFQVAFHRKTIGTMLDGGGYPYVYRRNPETGRQEKVLVHRLALLAFAGPCPEGMFGCHYNDIRTDNFLCNLRWDTPAWNSRDAVRNRCMRSKHLKGLTGYRSLFARQGRR